MFFFFFLQRAQSIVWNAFISKTVQTVWKSVPMACKVPTASSSSTLKPTTNAIPAMLTAPKGKCRQEKDKLEMWGVISLE